MRTILSLAENSNKKHCNIIHACVCVCIVELHVSRHYFFPDCSVLIPAVQKSETDLKLHFFNNCFDNDYSKGIVITLYIYWFNVIVSLHELD